MLVCEGGVRIGAEIEMMLISIHQRAIGGGGRRDGMVRWRGW